MKDYTLISQPAYSVIPFKRNELTSFLQLFPDTTLLKNMQKAAEQEEFEMALIYQNELSRRRRL